MYDFTNSVILPREDFIELSTAAWDHHPTPVAERVATTIQTTIVCSVLALAFSGATWAWYKAMSKLDREQTENEIAASEARANAYKK